ncbi:MAG: hypothetical protein Q8P40_12355 [Nitrospirota bacterium]|nr:hypothetical protein [Nitrospirota bacterium]
MDERDILIQMYREDCKFARHHEVLRATVANIIIAVTAGILGLVAFDQKLDLNDLPITIFLTFLGIFGGIFSSKHYERVRLHLNRAKQYLYKLEEIMPDIKLSELRERGNSANKSNFPRLFNLRLNKFWFALHLLISLLGFTMSAIIIFIALSKIR